MVNDTERWASKMFIHQRWIQSEADTLMAPAVEPVDPAEPDGNGIMGMVHGLVRGKSMEIPTNPLKWWYSSWLNPLDRYERSTIFQPTNLFFAISIVSCTHHVKQLTFCWAGIYDSSGFKGIWCAKPNKKPSISCRYRSPEIVSDHPQMMGLLGCPQY